jgi:WD40 repeat protein
MPLVAVETPRRPDLDDQPVEPRRTVLIYGLLAGIIGCVGGILAYRSLGWFPPRYAALSLIATAALLFAAGLFVGRNLDGRTQRLLGWGVVVLSLIAPLALVSFVPGIEQPTEHTIPGEPWLAISASPDGSADLYLMEGDAEHLIAYGETPWPELFVTLSPDRRHILYPTNIEGTYDLYVVELNAAGHTVGEQVRITSLPGDELGGDWSPDGTRIVFQEDTGNETEFQVVAATGGPTERIPTPASAVDPKWSPDGRSIAFAAPHDGDLGNYDIWVMSADGSEARPLVDAGPNDWWPNWSPDGTTIAFTNGYNGEAEVYMVNADGTGLVRLTVRVGEDTAYGWSPDGSKVLFVSDRSNTGGRFIYMMDRDGSNVQLALRI